jgi:hypothetical protein
LEFSGLRSQIAQLEPEIELYKSLQDQKPTSVLSFSFNVFEIHKLQLQLAERKSQLHKLQVKSPRAGVFLPVPETVEVDARKSGK